MSDAAVGVEVLLETCAVHVVEVCLHTLPAARERSGLPPGR